MKSHASYDDWGTQSVRQRAIMPEPVLEYLEGSAMVAWHGRIERQLISKIEAEEANRNFPYADKLRAFLQLWRQHEITGSINREPVEALKAAADILAVDDWSLSNYFSTLRDSLKQVLAKLEELPYDELSAPAEEPPPQGSPGAPPGQFGPEKEEPPGGPGAEPKPGEEGGPQDDFDLDKAVNGMSKDQKKGQPTAPQPA